MNRRQALIGIGSLAVGSGAALGSGAFTSVEADRDVSIETAGDDSAYLTLDGDGSYITDATAGETIALDLGSPGSEAFNKNATTQVADIVDVTNNAGDGTQTTVGFGPSGSQNGSETITLTDGSGNTVADVTFYLSSSTGFSGSGNAGTQQLSGGATAYIDAEIDTTVADASAADVSDASTLTISAA
jgi:hypothetical protein